MQRYRECHDFYHCLMALPVGVEYELALKHFEFANLGLPMTAIIFRPLRLLPKKCEKLFAEYVPWALRCGGSVRSLITVYWEERWEQNVDEMKKEFGIWDPPGARWSKPLSEAKLAAGKRRPQVTCVTLIEYALPIPPQKFGYGVIIMETLFPILITEGRMVSTKYINNAWR